MFKIIKTLFWQALYIYITILVCILVIAIIGLLLDDSGVLGLNSLEGVFGITNWIAGGLFGFYLFINYRIRRMWYLQEKRLTILSRLGVVAFNHFDSALILDMYKIYHCDYNRFQAINQLNIHQLTAKEQTQVELFKITFLYSGVSQYDNAFGFNETQYSSELSTFVKNNLLK